MRLEAVFLLMPPWPGLKSPPTSSSSLLTTPAPKTFFMDPDFFVPAALVVAEALFLSAVGPLVVVLLVVVALNPAYAWLALDKPLSNWDCDSDFFKPFCPLLINISDPDFTFRDA
eukprot:CAMPEP_0175061220 /NCGR_PEP_ID=MMETSP0052_2-20121109/13463_1 /TAXON_ID=51329 ORGANISM="Polytomella parva, Strain SAG 63-3" /NCGR_SAMPLE_ID=MMETSP0052_2 /ASSEMBLY_ACC=CAM_ASM_000194 /LENGTH=114 /DNA_ID=CAMNT_0016327049 /DNA_START=408 /DNA_END=752 /DNA_ORIENTATION=+